jgi:hypothetical protein
MAHLTLVLPFALPAPEFAPELARALDAPALAALLSRTSSHSVTPAASGARALPHELWLARALDLESGGKPAFATAAMHGFGLEPGEGTWFIVNPMHVEIGHSHLLMADPRNLPVSEEDGRALFDAARPWIEEAGYGFEYGDATTWFMRADQWTDLDTASPDTAVGMNLNDWMPVGAQALAYRKLQNEVQMVWHAAPVNDIRTARGLPSVNSFWLWSGTSVSPASANAVVLANAGTVPLDRSPHTENPKPDNSPAIATFETPGWISALGTRKLATPGEVLTAQSTNTLLICGNMAAPALSADWSAWLHQMQRLEAELFAPALAALMRGQLKELRLVLSHRAAHAEFTTTALAQRKFWRRPTLDRLI